MKQGVSFWLKQSNNLMRTYCFKKCVTQLLKNKVLTFLPSWSILLVQLEHTDFQELESIYALKAKA